MGLDLSRRARLSRLPELSKHSCRAVLQCCHPCCIPPCHPCSIPPHLLLACATLPVPYHSMSRSTLQDQGGGGRAGGNIEARDSDDEGFAVRKGVAHACGSCVCQSCVYQFVPVPPAPSVKIAQLRQLRMFLHVPHRVCIRVCTGVMGPAHAPHARGYLRTRASRAWILTQHALSGWVLLCGCRAPPPLALPSLFLPGGKQKKGREGCCGCWCCACCSR
jgi:hypothetical protein